MDLPPPLKRAISEASKSSYKQRVGAVIANKNKILARGYNKFRYHRFADYYPFDHTCHAEISAILNTQASTKNLSMYVARVNKRGENRLAKPCDSCMKVLQDLGFKSIYYTTNKGYNFERI